MVDDPLLIAEVAQLSAGELRDYIRQRADRIVSQTPGNAEHWDSSAEDWMMEGVELAHAVRRLLAQLAKDGV